AGALSERLALANLLSATLDAFDRVDILVNAHRLVKSSDPLDTDAGVLEDMLRQNMIAVLRLSQMVGKRMIKQAEGQDSVTQAGVIVNISTLASTRTVQAMLGYAIASAAEEQATRGLALLLARHKIGDHADNFSSVMLNYLQWAL